MAQAETIRRESRLVSPMPVRLAVQALLRVPDRTGWVVRSKALSAATDLHERLGVSQENDARPDCQVGEFHPGQLGAFMAEGRVAALDCDPGRCSGGRVLRYRIRAELPLLGGRLC